MFIFKPNLGLFMSFFCIFLEKAKEAQANGGFVADDDLEETDSSPVSSSKNSISPPPTRPQTSTLPGSPEDK